MPTTASDDGGELGEKAMVGATERSHPVDLGSCCQVSLSVVFLYSVIVFIGASLSWVFFFG
jgi:hypothetical protein